MQLGEKLKELRKSQKLTQQQLAERLGVQKSVISCYEAGMRYPSYDVLKGIARIFNVTTDYLLDLERKRVVDVSALNEEEIAVVVSVIDAIKRNKQ